MLTQEIDFPEGYEISLTQSAIQANWGNLNRHVNFVFKSLQTWDYNCVMWSLNINTEWKDFAYTDDGYANPDQSIAPYVKFFEENGFAICENGQFEENAIKICIFSRNGRFSHITRLREDSVWVSKMGEFEDIEHLSEFDVGGSGYGYPETYMKKVIPI